MDYTYAANTSSYIDWDRLHEHLRVVNYDDRPSYYVDWNLNDNSLFEITIEEPPEVDSDSLLQLLSEDVI